MALARREVLILGAIGAGAAVVGGLVGALARQAQRGAADLLAAPFRDLSGTKRTLREWQGRVLVFNFLATGEGPGRGEVPILVALGEGIGLERVVIGSDGAVYGDERRE